MHHAAELRRCLIECDVAQLRKLWRHVAPGLPQPDNDSDALVSLHLARTQAHTIPFRARAYSHRWLVDQGYPSALPDNLKPKAERIYPRVVDAVGISVNALSNLFKPITGIVRGAMEDAVMEMHCDRVPLDDPRVKPRMLEARQKTVKKLLGV